MRSYSLSQAAEFLGCARETIRRRLKEAGVKPVETYRGNARYTLRDICAAWFAPPRSDPDELPPFDRRAHYQAENIKLQIQNACDELVDLEDFVARRKHLADLLIGRLQKIREDLAQDPAIAAAVRRHLNRTIEQIRSLADDDDAGE